jgi:hypothetical protein
MCAWSKSSRKNVSVLQELAPEIQLIGCLAMFRMKKGLPSVSSSLDDIEMRPAGPRRDDEPKGSSLLSSHHRRQHDVLDHRWEPDNASEGAQSQAVEAQAVAFEGTTNSGASAFDLPKAPRLRRLALPKRIPPLDQFGGMYELVQRFRVPIMAPPEWQNRM